MQVPCSWCGHAALLAAFLVPFCLAEKQQTTANLIWRDNVAGQRDDFLRHGYPFALSIAREIELGDGETLTAENMARLLDLAVPEDESADRALSKEMATTMDEGKDQTIDEEEFKRYFTAFLDAPVQWAPRLAKRDLSPMAYQMTQIALPLYVLNEAVVTPLMSTSGMVKKLVSFITSSQTMVKKNTKFTREGSLTIPNILWDPKTPMRECAFNMVILLSFSGGKKQAQSGGQYQSEFSDVCSHGGYPALDNYEPSWLHQLFGVARPLRHKSYPQKKYALRCIIPNFPKNEPVANVTWTPRYCVNGGYRHYMDVALPSTGYSISTVPVETKPDDWTRLQCIGDDKCNAVQYFTDLSPFTQYNTPRKVSFLLEHQGSMEKMHLSSRHIRGLHGAYYRSGALLMVKEPPKPKEAVVQCCHAK